MAEVLSSKESVQSREIVIERADGSRGVVLVNINPIQDPGGNILGAVNCFQDVTERKRSERQIAALAREAEHRTKNILATVQAAVHLSQAETADGLKEKIQARIGALAKVHALFAASGWAGAAISSIAEQELAPYRRDGQRRAQIEGPEVVLETAAAQAVAVILHELSTNAAKYGSLSVPDGRLEVRWSHGPGRRLVLDWIESGGPETNKPTRESFGTSIVDRMVAQLNGEIRRDWSASGLACRIAIQLT